MTMFVSNATFCTYIFCENAINIFTVTKMAVVECNNASVTLHLVGTKKHLNLAV